MELKFIPIQASAVTALEISFLNKLFSSFLEWDPRSFSIVKIKFENGEEILAIDAPTDLAVGDVLVAVGKIEELIRTQTLEQIIQQYIS